MRCSYACGSADHVISRRSFLGTATAGLGLASGFSGMIRPAVSAELARRERQVLLIWLHGGASQLETWDPKPGTDTGGPFRSIETSRARRANLGADAANRQANASAGPGARGQHQGRRPRQGPVLDANRAPRAAGPGVPALGIAGRQVSELRAKPAAGLRSHSARRWRAERARGGFSRSRSMARSSWAMASAPANTTRASSLGDAGAAGREMLRHHLNDRFARRRRTAETDAYTTTYDQALQLMERRDAFDVTKEPARDLDRYGTHDFGRHCLLARRLLESGVTFVKVTHSNYDTHNENFDFHLEQVGEFDQSFSALLDDLAQRGRLEHTLVIVMSEFGRTPRINHLYGRDHWSAAWSVALAGAGIKPGMVLGKTNAKGTAVVDGQVNCGHLFHTYLRAVGLDPSDTFEVNGRAIQVADPTASAIKELLA